ncbi:MAG: DEAD/DEAH box helicase family protein [Streptosporangiaceae bacterium]|nr:DEAD/DEAH box helicase family protein [Streptosporangiaceae bacterium]
MSPGVHTEFAFEERVEYELLRRGWIRGPRLYDAELGLATAEMWEFVGKTQVKRFEKLIELHGGDQTAAMRAFAIRVANEIDARGVLDVLRHGVKDRGVPVDLCYFRPGHTLAVDALKEYDANVLSVARQLHFSARDGTQSVDLAFFVNGLPVASVELKNPMTRQDADDAVAQYRRRDPNELYFAKRTLVHFAVDPDRAFVTTRLSGGDTEFLPFNVGSAGAGYSGGAGNPAPVRDDYSVSYLWDNIWQRDNWLEILHRYLHVQTAGPKDNPHAARRIFPRYHQWDAVQRMVADARTRGAGQDYLIEHSAGSGKSNTIGWLAHRLSTLFSDANEQVFHKVIVITDRTVLDRQLQRTIYQFDHTPGVVMRIDEDAAQLAAALEDSTSKIIISTLQKFPYVLAKIAGAKLGGKRYAVIVDEAHSSQGGDAAARLRQAIGADSEGRPDETPLEYLGRMRRKQPNLSYFAFTATPTSRTLNLFGRFDPGRTNPDKPGETGMNVPFHVYSMRQAIEEGYILDVLANYLTYDLKWRLRNLAVEQQESASANPEVDERKAKRELVRFAVRHPTSVDQRAKLIIDDFRDNVARRLGGRAKAMVVTSSRADALAMYQAMQTYADALGYGTLVAFSGSLEPTPGVTVTEAQLNGFPEGQLPKMFDYTRADDPHAQTSGKREYRLLVAAEKYQTGFDQPLLCAMYVDKPLTGVAAVQTLSRLNRIHPLKSQDDVRVLDFVNSADDIQTAFKPWFETTIAKPEDPNLLYDKQREVMAYAVLAVPEMEAFVRVLTEGGPGRLPDAAERALHARLHGYLQPAIDRFLALEDDEQREGFRKALRDYTRAYALIAQIVAWGDEELERLYQYGRVLLLRLPGRPTTSVDIGDADLSHFRLEFTGAHSVSLSSSGEDGVVRGHSADGSGLREPEVKHLAEVIRELNERFGLDLGTGDEILVYQQVVGLVSDTEMQQVGLMNDEARFGQVADDRLDDIVAENTERNTEFMKLYFDNDEFRKAVKEAARRRAYRIITDPLREEALARLRAEMERETGGSGALSSAC